MCVLPNDLHFLLHALCERPRPLRPLRARFPLLSLRDIFPRSGGSLSSKGEPLAKPETLPYCQGLSLWERWHGVSRDGEGKPASKRQIYEKALVFQGENLERREPVNSNYRAPVVPLSLLRLWAQPLCTIGFLRRIAARVTVGVRQSLLACSALPLRGQ